MAAYIYDAKVVRVIDGDTLVLDVDLGFNITTRQTIRLYGINAPEIHGESRERGEASRKWLEEQLPAGHDVKIATRKDKREKYGRMLAFVYQLDNLLVSINQKMIDLGLAVAAVYQIENE